MRVFACGLLLLCLAGRVDATDVRADIRDLLARYDALGRLSGSVLVARGEEVVWVSAHGEAVREHRVPNMSETRFLIASMTKPITAAAVLALVADGRIELDAPLARYLPDYPREQADRVTIRQLLAHSSGIPSVGRRGDGLDEVTMRTATTLDAAIALSSSRALLFDPGTKHRYSNTGYMILAKVVETVSGMPFDRFLEERVFRPARMQATAPLDPRKVTPSLANGYLGYEPDVVRADVEHPTWGVGSGNLVSTTRDLHRFARALQSGAIVPKALAAAAFSPQAPVVAGSPYRYGFGWYVYDLDGHRVANHGGTLEGFIGSMFLLPDGDLFVTVLTNVMPRLGVDMADRIGEDLVRLALGKTVALPPMPVRRKLPAATAASRTFDFGEGRLLRVDRIDDHLQATAIGERPWSLVDFPRIVALDPKAAPIAQAQGFIDALRAGDPATFEARMTAEWKKNQKGERFVTRWNELLAEHGPYQASSVVHASKGRFHSITLRIAFERRDVDLTVVLDDQGRYAGWWLAPSATPRTVPLIPEAEGEFFVDAFRYDREDVRVALSDDGKTITVAGKVGLSR